LTPLYKLQEIYFLEGKRGVITVETKARIRRDYYVHKKSIKQI